MLRIQPHGGELLANVINETFLQLLSCSSQGGYVMMFYDKRLGTELGPCHVGLEVHQAQT